MKVRHATTGATLILVVLFTLLLLAVVLAATMRLGLASRQNTADQRTILQAQANAESGLNLVRSRLRDYSALLSSDREDGTVKHIVIKQSELPANKIKEYVEYLCTPVSGKVQWQAVDGGYLDKRPDPKDNKNYPNTQKCALKSSLSANDFTLFSKIFTADAYAVLPVDERPAGTVETDRNTFWAKTLTQVASTGADSDISTKSRIAISRVLKLETNHYRVFFMPQGVTARGGRGAASRVVKASPTEDTEWWFDIFQPSLLENVLLTDFHTNLAGSRVQFLTGINYDGPVHTNNHLSFGGSPSFNGVVSSAGCTSTSLSSITDTSEDCAHSYGVYTGTTWRSGRTTSAIKSLVDTYTDTNFNGFTPNFTAKWTPLPRNVYSQEKAVDGLDSDGTTPLPEGGKGLRLGTGDGIQMFAGYLNSSGTPTALSTYDNVNKKWVVPDGATEYQFIRPITSKTCNEDTINVSGCSYTFSNRIYRVAPDGSIAYRDGTGSWQSLSDRFNGLIYAENGFQSVIGPQTNRTTGVGGSTTDNANLAQPAIASFMGITLASDKDIKIRSDLALSQTPCRNQVYTTLIVSPPCNERKNVLGIYSQNGYVNVMKQAPNNAVIHAAIMASTKEFGVYKHDTGADRGPLNVVGAVIEKYYGAVGTAAPSNYSRSFSYDRRFKEGLTPPYFPVSPKWELMDARVNNTDFGRLVTKQGKASEF